MTVTVTVMVTIILIIINLTINQKKLKCRICKNSKNNKKIYYCLVDRVAVHRQSLVGVYRSTGEHTKIDYLYLKCDLFALQN